MRRASVAACPSSPIGYAGVCEDFSPLTMRLTPPPAQIACGSGQVLS